MSTLLFAQHRGPVDSEKESPRTPFESVEPTIVSSTVTTVDQDSSTAVWDSSPDFNEFGNDPVTEGGLTSTTLASAVIDRVKTPPVAGNFNEQDYLFGIVNRGQSTLGTAASREMNGEQGHGTLFITEGIEPTIVDGHEFNESYFAAGRSPVQFTAGQYMTSTPNPDSGSRHATQNQATVNSRRAVSASQYAEYYKAVTS